MKKSYMFAGISILIWSTIATIAKLLLGTLSNFQVLFVSCFFAFMFLLVVNIITGDIKKLRGYRFKDFIVTTLVGLPGTFLYQMFYYAGTARMPASQAFIVNYLWPIMGVVFAIIILREKLNLRKVIAIIMSFLGVVIVTCRDLAHFDKAIITGRKLNVNALTFWQKELKSSSILSEIIIISGSSSWIEEIPSFKERAIIVFASVESIHFLYLAGSSFLLSIIKTVESILEPPQGCRKEIQPRTQC